MAKVAGGKKGRKFGRNKDRSPSMKRYRNENRMEKNKARRIAKEKKRQESFKQAKE